MCNTLQHCTSYQVSSPAFPPTLPFLSSFLPSSPYFLPYCPSSPSLLLLFLYFYLLIPPPLPLPHNICLPSSFPSPPSSSHNPSPQLTPGKALTAALKPSWRQTTCASKKPKPSSQMVPQLPFKKISTRPSGIPSVKFRPFSVMDSLTGYCVSEAGAVGQRSEDKGQRSRVTHCEHTVTVVGHANAHKH